MGPLSCLSVTLVYFDLRPNGWMDQDGREVGLGPGDIVLDGDLAPPTKRGTAAPTFRPTLLWHGRPSQQLLSSFSVYYFTFYTATTRPTTASTSSAYLPMYSCDHVAEVTGEKT